MQSLQAELERNCEALKTCVNVRVIEGKFGINKLSKELSVSPDAFIQVRLLAATVKQNPKPVFFQPATNTSFMQMCIQCAWCRVHGAPTATYHPPAPQTPQITTKFPFPIFSQSLRQLRNRLHPSVQEGSHRNNPLLHQRGGCVCRRRLRARLRHEQAHA